ncbi:MAG: GxxExxY protein [Spirochaetae bacterium HGW-Spirochaetae-1]|nr:MAG: GxxExxY protein [Spirochaetae bacterium HGW-Spirochaetae-1]
MKKIDTINRISEAFYRVYNTLGYGFARDIYLRAFMVELDCMHIEYRIDHALNVYYEGIIVGTYDTDLVINNRIIVSIKADPFLADADEYGIENAVLATCCEAGILLNFGTAPEMCRKMGEGRDMRHGEEVPYSVCA